jgi:hypothetical protein
MRPFLLIAILPLLAAATCSPSESGGVLASVSLNALGPLRLDAADERFTDSPPTLSVTIIRASDNHDSSTAVPMDGALASGFNFSESTIELALPDAPCEDTREVDFRFKLEPPSDWATSVSAQYTEEMVTVWLLPDSSERVELWEEWELLITPDIAFVTETRPSNELPLKCFQP